MKRMQWFADKYIPRKNKLKVLDVGSYDVNGNYRVIFESIGSQYTGLDMENGPNVDIVPKDAYIWDEIENDTYDVVISGQALEHIEFFWKTMENMVRVTKKGGIICIIAPNGFSEHRYPVDCWRFFTDGMIALARYYMLKIVHSHTNAAPTIQDDDWFSSSEADSILIAEKPYEGEAREINLRGYKCIPTNHQEINNGMATYEDYKNSRIKEKEAREITEMENKTGAEVSTNTDIKSMIKARMKMMKRKLKNFILGKGQ